MKVGRVAIITRGRYAGKKVRQKFTPEKSGWQEVLRLKEIVKGIEKQAWECGMDMSHARD